MLTLRNSIRTPAGVRFSISSEGDSGGRGRAGSNASPNVPIRKSLVGTSLDPSTGQLYRGYNGSGAVLPTDGSFDPVAFLSLVHSKASIGQLKQGRQHLTTQLGNEQGGSNYTKLKHFYIKTNHPLHSPVLCRCPSSLNLATLHPSPSPFPNHHPTLTLRPLLQRVCRSWFAKTSTHLSVRPMPLKTSLSTLRRLVGDDHPRPRPRPHSRPRPRPGPHPRARPRFGMIRR